MFSNAVRLYVTGLWPQARALLQQALWMVPDDGPAMALLEFMAQHNFQAPRDWNGFRSITTSEAC